MLNFFLDILLVIIILTILLMILNSIPRTKKPEKIVTDEDPNDLGSLNLEFVAIKEYLPIVVPKKKINYYVNNRLIPCHFERYYYLKLGMALPIMRVDEDVLERHYHRKMFEKIEDIDAVKDLEAAQAFFNDLIQYTSYLN